MLVWMWLLLLRLLKHKITQSETSLNNRLELGWIRIFCFYGGSGAYIPIRGLIEGKTIFLIECSFYFYGYWSKSTK